MQILRTVFRIAAVYNIAWGVAVVLFPNLFFDIFGLPHINYPFVMSGLGMCIGLYGYGYWVVAQEPRRYPQLVVIGFLGKALGPIGWRGRSSKQAYHCAPCGPTFSTISSGCRSLSPTSSGTAGTHSRTPYPRPVWYPQ